MPNTCLLERYFGLSLFNSFWISLLQSNAGSVLIAINPLKDTKQYGNGLIAAYRQKVMNNPHVYAIADSAYSAMMQGKTIHLHILCTFCLFKFLFPWLYFICNTHKSGFTFLLQMKLINLLSSG